MMQYRANLFSKFFIFLFIIGHECRVQALWKEYFERIISEHFKNANEREKAQNLIAQLDQIEPFIHKMAEAIAGGDEKTTSMHENNAVAIMDPLGYRHTKMMTEAVARITLAYSVLKKKGQTGSFAALMANMLVAEKMLAEGNIVGGSRAILIARHRHRHRQNDHHNLTQHSIELDDYLKQLRNDVENSMYILAQQSSNKNANQHHQHDSALILSPSYLNLFDSIKPLQMKNFDDYWKMMEMSVKMIMAIFEDEGTKCVSKTKNEKGKHENDEWKKTHNKEKDQEKIEKDDLFRLLKTLTMPQNYFQTIMPEDENSKSRRRRRRKRDLNLDFKTVVFILLAFIGVCLFCYWASTGFKVPCADNGGANGENTALASAPAAPAAASAPASPLASAPAPLAETTAASNPEAPRLPV